MYGQQNYYQGRGRGGRAGGGGGGRGGRGRGAPFPRYVLFFKMIQVYIESHSLHCSLCVRYTPTFKVNTNLFDVTFTSEQRWHQYEINIIPSSLSKDSNEIKAAHPEKVERFQKTLKRGSNSRSREILNELYKQLLRKQMVLAVSFKKALLKEHFWAQSHSVFL